MIRINLAPPDQRRARGGFEFHLPTANLGLLFAVAYGAVVVLIAAYWFSLYRAEARLAAEVARANRELATLKVQLGDAPKVKEMAIDLQKRVATIQQLTKNQARPMLLLDAFLDSVPPDLWITTLEERGALLKISGTAFSTSAVSDFMVNLRSSGKFKEIDIIVAKQDLNKSPVPVTFEVTCRFES
jgi:Tfp pilus assembly protein PilN